MGQCDETAEALEKMDIYASNATTSEAVDCRIELYHAKMMIHLDLIFNKYTEDEKLHQRAVDDFIRGIQLELEFDSSKEIRSLHDGRRTYACYNDILTSQSKYYLL